MTKTAGALHVTNGDSVLYLFRKAGILGTHLAWRDALNDGPVPHGLTLEQTSTVRAGYLASRGLGTPIKLIHDFQTRDAQLRKAALFEEVVLWFEHDLYDQLQILQILHALDELDLEPGRVALVQSDHYLGAMTADEIAPLLSRRRTVTAATFKSALRGWERFTAPDCAGLYAAAQEDTIGLPFLRVAMRRLCEEYPWSSDGLSRSQRQALQAVAQGPARNEELYRRAQSREEAHFLGDRAFYRLLRDLVESPAPLVEGEEAQYAATALGRRVLAGDADWLEEAPIDRWIGGMRLASGHLVRWDDERSVFA